MPSSTITTHQPTHSKNYKRQHRQISRIIKHLRDQLSVDEQFYLPSDAVVDSLVQQTLLEYYFRGEDWSLIIKHTLRKISQLQQDELPKQYPQVRCQHIHAFVQRLLREMPL